MGFPRRVRPRALPRPAGPRPTAPLHLHLGYDGGRAAVRRRRPGAGRRRLGGGGPRPEGHHLLDCAVATAGDDWDNNSGANYRLWLGLDPVDAHVHARTPGLDPMGFESLRTAAGAPGGMTHALVSWQDNDFVDRSPTGVALADPAGLGAAGRARARTTSGGGWPAARSGSSCTRRTTSTPPTPRASTPSWRWRRRPACRSPCTPRPGPSDPDLIRRLAERFPHVPFVLYHTFLGLPEGRRRAAPARPAGAEPLPGDVLVPGRRGAAAARRGRRGAGAVRVRRRRRRAGALRARSRRTSRWSRPTTRACSASPGTLPAETFRALVQDNTRRLFGLGPAVTTRRRMSARCSPTRSRWPSG